MQNKGLRIAACFMTSALLFSGMNIDAFAIEGTGLPSAGIDFFLSTDATSVKSLTDEGTAGKETDAAATDNAAVKESGEEYQEIKDEEVPLSQSGELEIAAIPKDIVIEETAIASMDKTVPQKERELAEQMAAAQMNWTATAGGYFWPETKSKRITSPMGGRDTGIKGASTNHKGVDIGGVGYSTNVLATKAGIVTISKRSSSYGEYVVIQHGPGNTTLYAHMSSRAVKEGDVVSQGQVIGVTGSTGISSGPHLHYEITEGGSRVNPLNYLPGYIKAW